MTQGIFVNGGRAKSKKAVKEAFLADPNSIRVEATSFFGNEYDGSLVNAPKDSDIYFVGPDPHTDRRFYGKASWNAKKETWVIS